MTTITHLTLDREALKGILQAYDAAWSSLQGSIFASTRRSGETRAIITQSIIDTAERGDRDPDHLRDNALRQFGMAQVAIDAGAFSGKVEPGFPFENAADSSCRRASARPAGTNGRRCDRCHRGRPLAPIRSRYRAPGLVEHDWICSNCGNEWTTSTQVGL